MTSGVHACSQDEFFNVTPDTDIYINRHYTCPLRLSLRLLLQNSYMLQITIKNSFAMMLTPAMRHDGL